MVSLTRIYTRTGDDGSTALIGNERRSKADNRIEAIGAVDELNAVIGEARLRCPDLGRIHQFLARIQNDLFDLGADLATVARDDQTNDDALRISDPQVNDLETEIDRLNADLEPLQSFVLPGGTAAATGLHLARTTARRAERTVVTLADSGEPISAPSLRYLNRLSDLLFVMARWANDRGAADILWIPGQNR